jgi:RNA polymerase sigma-70 factor (ECF subfamily)
MRRDVTMDQELKDVVARVRGGEETAFDELYQRTVRQLYRTLYTYLMVREDVDDVVQEAYLKLYLHRKRLDDSRSVPMYLRTIAINCARRTLRRPRVIVEPEEDSVAGEFSEIGGLVREALEKLTPADRLVIGLFYGDQSSIHDICCMTREKEGTVKSRLSRARDRLREVIGHGQ